MQKRANSLALWVGAVAVSILIYPLLAAGLPWSVGRAGGVDRTATRCADQVAPVGRGERLRSPGDRT
jgi:hypothetical protein